MDYVPDQQSIVSVWIFGQMLRVIDTSASMRSIKISMKMFDVITIPCKKVTANYVLLPSIAGEWTANRSIGRDYEPNSISMTEIRRSMSRFDHYLSFLMVPLTGIKREQMT